MVPGMWKYGERKIYFYPSIGGFKKKKNAKVREPFENNMGLYRELGISFISYG